MVSNQFKIYLVSLFLISLCCEVLRAQDKASLLFQAGLYAEEIQGNLDKAINYFEMIVTKYPDDRPLAAKALLHMGFCFEKLGQEQAEEAFRKIVEEYPDQREIATLARDRLARLKKSEIQIPKSKIEENPLVRYYFERIGIDPLTSISWDGNYLAYTDWTTGSLMISSEFGMRNFDFGERELKSSIVNPKYSVRIPKSEIRNRKSPVRIVAADFSRSPEFAYNPVFSRDGQWLAYSWYRAPFFVELRTVSVTDGQSRLLYSNPEIVIFPQDWSPDGKSILCRIFDSKQDPQQQNYLVIITFNSGNLKELTALGANSRGMKFSPDGKFITYDLPKNINSHSNRHIYIFNLDKMQESRVTGGIQETNDTPVWSPDGKLILYRSSRLGKYDLWALPVNKDKPAGIPYLLQSEMNKVLLSMQGIQEHASKSLIPPSKNRASVRNSKKTILSFDEQFSSTKLHPAWSVYEWQGPNVYGYQTFGRYSLTDHPGCLRYYLDPIMIWGYDVSYQPNFTGFWYWEYPGLEISRPLFGNHWMLETRVTYSIVDGANARIFALIIFFDSERDLGTVLSINRMKEFGKHLSKLVIKLFDQGNIVAISQNCLAQDDSLGVTEFTYFYRISRADTLISVELSEEGVNYKNVLKGTLRAELRGLPQRLALTGLSWYVPAGSYADWDYIRFKVLDK